MVAVLIALHWSQVSDFRLEAEHDGRKFVIAKMPNWDRHPQLNYDYRASVQHGAEVIALGTFTDSTAARAKCAEFINSKTAQGD